MNTLLLVAALVITPTDGSLLFVENGNQVVQNHTDSTLSHVAIILKEENDFWVYEATPPKVRKILLSDYYAEVKSLNSKKKESRKMKLWMANPTKPFTAAQKETMKKYLEGELGRKYSIGSYLNGRAGKGIHCGELVGNALRLANLKFTDNTCQDDPWDVWDKTKTIYEDRKEINIQ